MRRLAERETDSESPAAVEQSYRSYITVRILPPNSLLPTSGKLKAVPPHHIPI